MWKCFGCLCQLTRIGRPNFRLLVLLGPKIFAKKPIFTCRRVRVHGASGTKLPFRCNSLRRSAPAGKQSTKYHAVSTKHEVESSKFQRSSSRSGDRISGDQQCKGGSMAAATYSHQVIASAHCCLCYQQTNQTTKQKEQSLENNL